MSTLYIKRRLQRMESDYRDLMQKKKTNPKAYNASTLFNQLVLTEMGRLHAKAIAAKQENKFWEIAGNTLPCVLYKQWRQDCAASIADILDIYKTLNVKLVLEDIRGETWYAGIPSITQKEIDAIKAKTIDDPFSFVKYSEKIGLDGLYHDVDCYGEFRPMVDTNDVYGDGTMFSLAEVNEYLKNNPSKNRV